MHLVALCRVALLLCLLGSGVRAAERLPNIVFIMADDLGVMDLGVYGRRDHRTPHLDRLASDGVRFTSAYCAQPICSPARAAIMTGRAPARLHLTSFIPGRADAPTQKLLQVKMRQSLPLEEFTIAELLKERGYVNGYVGKWHLGGRGALPTDQGFDFYHPGTANTRPSETEGGKGEYDLTQAAEQFVETNREKPFFLFLSHNNPHVVFTAHTNRVAANKSAYHPLYAAVVETLDDSVGRLLAKLDALGLREETLVIFTSDNGGLHVPEVGHKKVTHNAPYRAGKGFVYEGGLRIPLLVRWPGQIPPGRVVDEPANQTDWAPTFSEICGANAKKPFDGRSILAALRGGTGAQRKLFWHLPHYTNQGSEPAGAVRDGEWKLVEHYSSGKQELYNLKQDISEQVNLAAQQPQLVKRLAAELNSWRETISAQINEPNPNYDAALGRAIYTEFDSSSFDPSRATAAEHERMLEWRRRMDAATKRPAIP